MRKPDYRPIMDYLEHEIDVFSLAQELDRAYYVYSEMLMKYCYHEGETVYPEYSRVAYLINELKELFLKAAGKSSGE